MKSNLSIHDNTVYAYSVDCQGRRLVLHTAYGDHPQAEWTDVIFENVVAHHFEHVLQGNILFGVEETDIATFVRDNERMLADSWRYGWPPLQYNGNLSELTNALNADAVRAYFVHASLGLSGWVLAGSCEFMARSDAAKLP